MVIPLPLGSSSVDSCTQMAKRTKLKVKVKDALRLAVYHQSIRFGVKPLENHDQRFFFSIEPFR
jgi:hypothetical protein